MPQHCPLTGRSVAEVVNCFEAPCGVVRLDVGVFGTVRAGALLADDGVATVELFLADTEGDDVDTVAVGVAAFACFLE